MTDYRYHNATGVNFGLTGQYNFNDWLGLAGGLGLEYGISRHWAVQLEARGYYGLASQVKQYMRVKDYRYDTTVVLQAACLYRF